MGEKYKLGGYDTDGVKPMPESQQTLTDCSIEVVDGKTVMKFTKIMKEAGEIEISTGDNNFLWALGEDNTLAYHKDRAPFQLNLSSAPPANGCMEEFCGKQLSDDYVLQYKINVPDGTPGRRRATADACEGCTVSMELTYDGEAWVGFAVSKEGGMLGSEAVIGL